MKLKHYLTLVLLLSLFGCKSSAQPTLQPAEIVSRAVARMQSLAGFHFVIERDGAPAYLNANKSLAFSRAEGDYVTPDRAQASVRVITPGLVAEVKVIAIGEQYWQTNPLTSKWERLPVGLGFNPIVLFDPKIGFQAILKADLIDITLAGMEELEEMPGKKLSALTGKMKGDNINKMSDGLIGPEAIDVKLWVDPDTDDIYRVQLTEPAIGSDKATIWLIDFMDFDKTVQISPPP